MSKFSKELILFIVIVGLNQILIAILLREIYPIQLHSQKPFFLELTELNFRIPLWIFFIFNSINILLLYFIGRVFFHKKYAFIVSLIFAMSPWSAYLTVAGSFYIILQTFILLIVLGILRREMKLIIAGILLSIYSSIILLMIMPPFFIGLIKFKLLNREIAKKTITAVLILSLPLILLGFSNIAGLKNIYQNQVTIFSGPGLMTAVNNFQGETKKEDLNILARIIENKYIYFGEYIILKIFKNLVPATFFTPQEKLLNFSFTPPIFIALLIPFLFGLFKVLNSAALRKIFILSLALIIPSLLSKSLVDLNRLSLFMPVVILIISLGLIEIKFKKSLFLISLLVLLQLSITLFDINQREYLRYERYLGTGFEIGKQ